MQAASASIEPKPSSDDPEKFWPRLVDLKKVHLKDKDGIVIAPDALPRSLEQLPDDPYRTLAWMVRKKGGFCRGIMDQREFAEFIWADFMRGRAEFPATQVAAAPDKLLKLALKLAKSPAAEAMPGYVGNKPASFTCLGDRKRGGSYCALSRRAPSGEGSACDQQSQLNEGSLRSSRAAQN